jgi:pyruvate kinase
LSDIANAVMDGADGLVLSAETAIGSYVLESIDTMRRVAHQAEKNTDYAEYQVLLMHFLFHQFSNWIKLNTIFCM